MNSLCKELIAIAGEDLVTDAHKTLLALIEDNANVCFISKHKKGSYCVIIYGHDESKLNAIESILRQGDSDNRPGK